MVIVSDVCVGCCALLSRPSKQPTPTLSPSRPLLATIAMLVEPVLEVGHPVLEGHSVYDAIFETLLVGSEFDGFSRTQWWSLDWVLILYLLTPSAFAVFDEAH